MTMIERVARAITNECTLDYDKEEFYIGGIVDVRVLAKAAIAAMQNPSDELLLAPGQPYRVQRAIDVPISEGIKRRREAWNKIIDAALKE